MSKSSSKNDKIGQWKEAFQCNYNLKNLSECYNLWAQTYDIDVHQLEYVAPQYMSQQIFTYLNSTPLSNLEKLTVLDVGCGTGILGNYLYDLGFRHIDGLDISRQMIEKAKEKEVYQLLATNADLNKTYDLVISCGMFTIGHVYPNTLENLIQYTHINGLIYISIREDYYKFHHFNHYYQHLIDQGVLELIGEERDIAYLKNYTSAYILFKRLL